MNILSITPLKDRVLVEPILENVTDSGLIVSHPDLINDHLRKGRAVAVGPQCKYVKQGDLVLYEKHRGHKREIEGKTYIELREEYEIEGILEENQ